MTGIARSMLYICQAINCVLDLNNSSYEIKDERRICIDLNLISLTCTRLYIQ